jgi:hypothetical protein
MDAIHVLGEEGGEHGKVEGNTILETNHYLWIMHENRCHVKPPLHSNLKTIALKGIMFTNKVKKIKGDIWKQIHKNPKNGWK